MSGDEFLVTLASLVAGFGGWSFWLFRAGSIHALQRDRPTLKAAAATLGSLSLILLFVLLFLAADDVRDAPGYVFMYLMLGLAWLRLSAALFPIVGLNPRDDLFERQNHAALLAWVGAMTGIALCYAGGNVGNGPGWWVVVFAAALATAGLGAVWFALGHWAGLVDSVVIERDPAAGLRLGGALAACGLMFGTAVAGDWISVELTVADFATKAWPAVPLVAALILVEPAFRPRPDRPRAPVMVAGVLPVTVCLVVAAGVSWLKYSPW